MRFLPVLFLMCSASFAQFSPQPEAEYSHPVETPFGIIVANSMSSSLFLLHDGIVEELINSPGCGEYFTVSPDGKTIGFKSIGPDGLQSPALFDLSSRTIFSLHEPVRQAGQVSFARNGEIAYSIGNDVYVRRGSAVDRYSLGTYANIVALSFDGASFAYNDQNDQIMIYDRARNKTSRITGGSGSYVQPVWSPVEHALCFSGFDASVYVYHGKGEKIVSLGKGYDPVWSADGQFLIMERRETEKHTLNNSDLYRISADGSTAERLTDTKNIFETSASIRKDHSVLFASHTAPSVYSLNNTNRIDLQASIAHEKIVPLPKERRTTLRKSSSPSVYFEMPYTHQVYDTPDWYNGHWACGPTSSIMVIAYYGILPVWNVWCSASGSSPAHYSAYGNYVCDKYRFKQFDYVSSAKDPNDHDSWGGFGYMWSTGSPHSRMTYYYQYHGIAATLADSTASFFNLVSSEVANGYPYTLCNGLTTAGHIIVLNGIGTEAHTFIANDPYGNKGSGKYPSVNGKGVSYDWPGYNNGNANLNRIYWGVAVRYTPPVVGDTVVDDLQFTKGFSMSNASPSSMYSWKDMNQGFNGHMWYVKTKKSDTCYALWRPTIAQDGNYEVSAYIPVSNAQAARYKIYHKNGMETVVANQKSNAGSWLNLGTYPFSKGTAGYVRLGDGSDSAGQELAYDALQFKYRSPLSARSNPAPTPDRFVLDQNFPNPFNPATTISFSVPFSSAPAHIILKVYDMLGSEVATAVDERLEGGSYSVTFDAALLSSGTYFYRLQSGNTVLSKKMILMK